MLNQCLLYRYVISYEPYHFKGHLDDFPLTIAYGRQVDAFRTELRDYLWDGEFCDTVGARVTEDGHPHHPFTVFRHTDRKRLCVAVANYEADRPSVVEVQLENGQVLTHYRLVGESAWQRIEGAATIPPAQRPCSFQWFRIRSYQAPYPEPMPPRRDAGAPRSGSGCGGGAGLAANHDADEHRVGARHGADVDARVLGNGRRDSPPACPLTMMLTWPENG